MRLKHILLPLLATFFMGGCGLFENEQTPPEWEDLQFPVESGYKLFLSDGDLYVAADKDGLYYLEEANPENGWKYLGYNVPEGESYGDAAVQAVDVYENTIIIGTRGLSEQSWGGLDRHLAIGGSGTDLGSLR